MRVLRKIFEYYVKASIHVALAVLALLYLTCQFLNIPVNKSLFFLVFFSTIPTYNVIRQISRKRNRFYGLFNMPGISLTVSLVSLGLSLYFITYLKWQTLLTLLVLSLLTAIYTLPILPEGKNLRHRGLVKILIIGLVWTGTTVLLPVVEVASLQSWDVWVEFVQRLLLILVLMVPFEIRDLGTDPADMLTIPQRLGIARTRRLGLWACLICYLLTFMMDELSGEEILGKTMMVLSLGALLIFLPKKQPRFFASFWVEAFPIFWVLALWGIQALV